MSIHSQPYVASVARLGDVFVRQLQPFEAEPYPRLSGLRHEYVQQSRISWQARI
jgi:hypothetical protein